MMVSESGRAPSGQAGRASHGAADASPPYGDHPSRECDHYKLVSGSNGPWTCVSCGAVNPERPKYDKPRPIPNVWGGNLDAVQSLGPRLRAVKWNVQGRNTPDNLFDWLTADNRYPQHRGRSAALRFISEQAETIAAALAQEKAR